MSIFVKFYQAETNWQICGEADLSEQVIVHLCRSLLKISADQWRCNFQDHCAPVHQTWLHWRRTRENATDISKQIIVHCSHGAQVPIDGNEARVDKNWKELQIVIQCRLDPSYIVVGPTDNQHLKPKNTNPCKIDVWAKHASKISSVRNWTYMNISWHVYVKVNHPAAIHSSQVTWSQCSLAMTILQFLFSLIIYWHRQWSVTI